MNIALEFLSNILFFLTIYDIFSFDIDCIFAKITTVKFTLYAFYINKESEK